MDNKTFTINEIEKKIDLVLKSFISYLEKNKVRFGQEENVVAFQNKIDENILAIQKDIKEKGLSIIELRNECSRLSFEVYNLKFHLRDNIIAKNLIEERLKEELRAGTYTKCFENSLLMMLCTSNLTEIGWYRQCYLKNREYETKTVELQDLENELEKMKREIECLKCIKNYDWKMPCTNEESVAFFTLEYTREFLTDYFLYVESTHTEKIKDSRSDLI